MVIRSRPSIWLMVVSMVLVAFIALPTFHNYCIFGIIILLQVVLIWQARHEGRGLQPGWWSRKLHTLHGSK
jgi:hypothetical protein